MADIINFNGDTTPALSPEITHSEQIQLLINELQKEAGVINQLLVYVKDMNNDMTLFHTGLSLADRSYIVQLLQEDIQAEITSMSEDSIDVEFEPDQ